MTVWHEQDVFWQTVPLFDQERLEAAPQEVDATISMLGIESPAEVLDLCCGVGRHSLEFARRGYRVTGVDRMTGNNTVVVLCADHGEMLGDHYCWAKSRPYEGAARIPMMIRAPERFGVGPRAVIDRPVGLEDIMPTVLEMADVPVPDTVEGQSLLPLMRGEAAEWRSQIRIQCGTAFQCLTDGREKYVRFTEGGREQFFDLTEDPKELRDLVDVPDRAERVAWWRERLEEELGSRGT